MVTHAAQPLCAALRHTYKQMCCFLSATVTELYLVSILSGRAMAGARFCFYWYDIAGILPQVQLWRFKEACIMPGNLFSAYTIS
jgi:hypothetical protein